MFWPWRTAGGDIGESVADDDFLVAIVQQALVAYATHQLDVCRAALQNWQAEAALVVSTGDLRVHHELACYTPRSSAGKATWSRLRTEFSRGGIRAGVDVA